MNNTAKCVQYQKKWELVERITNKHEIVCMNGLKKWVWCTSVEISWIISRPFCSCFIKNCVGVMKSSIGSNSELIHFLTRPNNTMLWCMNSINKELFFSTLISLSSLGIFFIHLPIILLFFWYDFILMLSSFHWHTRASCICRFFSYLVARRFPFILSSSIIWLVHLRSTDKIFIDLFKQSPIPSLSSTSRIAPVVCVMVVSVICGNNAGSQNNT